MNISILKPSNLDGELREAWQAIRAAEPELASPLLAPEWTDAVSQVREDVEVAVIRRGGEPIAFWPWQRISSRGAIPVGGELADAQAVICGWSAGQTKCENAADWRVEDVCQATGVRTFHFDHVVASQPYLQPFHAAHDDAWMVDLSAGYAAFAQELRGSSSRIAQAERRRRKLIREVGELRFQWHDASEAAQRALLQWKQDQLATARRADIYQARWARQLVGRIAGWSSPGFEGRLASLSAGGNLLAVHLGIIGGSYLSSWIPAHDPRFARYSPGMLLHLELIREAAARGIDWIDLGRGENPLKRALANRTVSLAIGSVDLRPILRFQSALWYGLRNRVHRTPHARGLLAAYRRVRCWTGSPGGGLS